MGKSCGNYSTSYHANRSSGCPYNGNRSGSCPSSNRQRTSAPCCANERTNTRSAGSCAEPLRYENSRCETESRGQSCKGENLNRSAPCRSQNEYICNPAKPYCDYEPERRADFCACECAAPAYDGGKASACCENESSRASYDAACGYVWRGTEQENCAEEYENCPAELHVHEAQGSTQAAGDRCAPHTHRFACVTCEPIMLRDGRHAHKLTFRTDSCEGHCHEFSGMTTGEYEICDCHVHYLEGETSRQAGHCHSFRLVTHIGNPMED